MLEYNFTLMSFVNNSTTLKRLCRAINAVAAISNNYKINNGGKTQYYIASYVYYKCNWKLITTKSRKGGEPLLYSYILQVQLQANTARCLSILSFVVQFYFGCS